MEERPKTNLRRFLELTTFCLILTSDSNTTICAPIPAILVTPKTRSSKITKVIRSIKTLLASETHVSTDSKLVTRRPLLEIKTAESTLFTATHLNSETDLIATKVLGFQVFTKMLDRDTRNNKSK